MSFVKRGYGNFFVQEDPTDEMKYLTSIGVGDVTTPGRARTPVYDPDVRRSGEFKASDFIRGEPGEVTMPLTRPLDTVANFLQETKCAFNARVNWACRGDRNIVWNYELAQLLIGAEFESGATGQPVIAAPGEEDRVATSGDTKSLQWTYLYLLTGISQTVTGVAPVNDIAFLPEECGDRCGPRIKLGWHGYAVRDTLGYLLGDSVIKTVNGGGDWNPTTADPFLGAKNGLCLLTVETATGHRIIVGGGPEAGVAAEVSYSDDGGASWTDVTVGAVLGQGINALFEDELGYIWAAADDGYVYRSTNLAASWTAMHSATKTAEDLTGVVFLDARLGFAVGDTNAFIYTPDGGTTWDALTGPEVGADLTSIAANRSNYLFITTSTGVMHRSIDAGESFATVLDMAGGSFARLRFDFDFEYFGYAAWNNVAGVGTMMRSEDGGVTFMEWDTPANTGLRSLFICDPNMLSVCGSAAGPLGYIAKFVRASS